MPSLGWLNWHSNVIFPTLLPATFATQWLLIQDAHVQASNGRYLAAKRDYPAAINALEVGCTQGLSEDFISPCMDLADLKLTVMQAPEAAIALYPQVLARKPELEPKNPLPEIALARLAIARKKVGEAEQHAQRAVDIDPNFADALMALGEAYQAGGKLDRALQQFEAAAKAAPNAVGPVLRQAMLQ
jgi:tetratricopeptide (TPR) repeat protein